MSRNTELAQIHIAKKQLGLDEETYRLMLHNITGKNSTKEMTINERYKVLAHLHKVGFKPKTKKSYSKITNWRKPRIAKIVALWCVLFDAKIVKDKSYAAMENWCSTLTGKDSLNWSTANDLNKCIEGLKSWCNREGIKHD